MDLTLRAKRRARRFVANLKRSDPKRECKTYSYWYDLRTDLRRPKSLLDFANMILRRFRLILVKEVDDKTKEFLRWKLRGWVALLDEIHEQGKCKICQGIIQDIEEIVAEIEKKKGLEPWLDTIWFIECKNAYGRFWTLMGPHLNQHDDGFLTIAWSGVAVKTEYDDPPEELCEPGIYLELSDGSFRQLDASVLFEEQPACINCAYSAHRSQGEMAILEPYRDLGCVNGRSPHFSGFPVLHGVRSFDKCQFWQPKRFHCGG